MFLQLVILGAGIAVSALVGYLVSSRDSTKTSIRDACIGAFVGGILFTLATLQYETAALRLLRQDILRPNELSRLDELLEDMPEGTPLREAVFARRVRLRAELSDILKGRLKLHDEDEVIQEWTRSFSEAVTRVDATNYVTPTYWLRGSEFSARQLGIQTSARARAVIIRRIFIYPGGSSSELGELQRLADDQRAIGISVRFLPYTRLVASPSFVKYSPSLDGGLDFVLFDLNAVLITFPNLETRQIEWGFLTKERAATDAARDLFERLWSVADEKL